MKISRSLPLFQALSLALIAGCAARSRPSSSSLAPSANSTAPRHVFAEKIKISGVGGVGRISDDLLRGSQPTEKGLKELKHLGITTVVDLRGERHGRVHRERERVEALGMTFVNIHASGSPPTSSSRSSSLLLKSNLTKKSSFTAGSVTIAPASFLPPIASLSSTGRPKRLSPKCTISTSRAFGIPP